MRFSLPELLNGFAWGVIWFLVGAAAAITFHLGFFALILFGLLVSVICVGAELSEKNPPGKRVRPPLQEGGKGVVEARLAEGEATRTITSALRYYRLCGLTLALIGACGFLLQQLLQSR